MSGEPGREAAALTVADLFCGAGGLSEGFRLAGFRIVAGSDNDPDAVATYAHNFPNALAVGGDIRDPGIREQVSAAAAAVDVLVGGPPCQAFSQVRNHSRAQPEPELVPEQAWEHVYRLLLWVDRTTGLAHCYESDKSQPGRPWYARSLAFHDWVSTALDVAADELGDHIDVLFRSVTADLATAAAAARAARAGATAAQREPYSGRGLPEPGHDPELEAIIVDSLAGHLASDPPTEVLRALTERIQLHVGQENKRKNLVGEGFEDTLASLLSRMPGVASASEVRVRALLHEVRGVPPAPRRQQETAGRSGPHLTQVGPPDVGVVQVERSQRPRGAVRQRLPRLRRVGAGRRRLRLRPGDQ